ncbi:MAG: carboxymuconolactone decarboxylase family protein [Alphaproteobacteria bacterium]
MTRIADVPADEFSAEQRRIADEIEAGPRGAVIGPLAVWMRSPVLCDRAQKLGEFTRFNSSLPKRLSELAILVTARHWGAQFEWHHHAPIAREAGVPAAAIEALRTRADPVFDKSDEALVHEFATTLYATRTVPQDLYDRAVAELGERGVVDLVGLLGYYALISMTLNVFDVSLPEGETPPLAD